MSEETDERLFGPPPSHVFVSDKVSVLQGMAEHLRANIDLIDGNVARGDEPVGETGLEFVLTLGCDSFVSWDIASLLPAFEERAIDAEWEPITESQAKRAISSLRVLSALALEIADRLAGHLAGERTFRLDNEDEGEAGQR